MIKSETCSLRAVLHDATIKTQIRALIFKRSGKKAPAAAKSAPAAAKTAPAAAKPAPAAAKTYTF